MNNNSNINFRGAFLVKFPKTVPNIRQGFETAIGKNGKIVYENFDGKGRTLYVMKNSKDYNAANFIKTNGLRFEYMPDLDTHLRFEPNEPNVVHNYIADNSPIVLKKMKELMSFIAQHRTQNRAIKNSHIGFYDNILNKLKINVKGEKTKDCKGVLTIEDKANDGLVKISPLNKNNISYVYVKPSNQYDDPMRYAVDKEGNILMTYKTPDAIQKFHEGFNKAIKYHISGSK